MINWISQHYLLPILSNLYFEFHDWGIAIIFLTVLVRFLLFPVSLSQAKYQVKNFYFSQELKKTKDELGNDIIAIQVKMQELMKKHQVNPLKLFATTLIQLPIFMAVYSLFRSFKETSDTWLPWIHSWSSPDPLMLLPIFAAVLIGFSSQYSVIPSNNNSNQKMSVIMALMMLVFLWRTPAAVILYIITSTVYSFFERMFYRTTLGRKWIGYFPGEGGIPNA